MAAAVVLPDRVRLPGLNDSKQLTRADRERLDGEIREQALAVSVAEVSVEDVDRLNVLRASPLAMRRAVLGSASRRTTCWWTRARFRTSPSHRPR